MANESTVELRLKALNLTQAAFAEANKQLEALGVEVQKTNEKTKGLAGGFTNAGSSAGVFGGSLARLTAAFSVAGLIDRGVGALFSYGAEALRSAGATVDLSAKTGLALKTIQEFSFAAQQTGTSTEAFTNAALKLGVNLAGGSGSVQAAVRAVGLEYQNLKALSPDEQFNAVTEALKGMESPQERNRLGLVLFGKQFAEIAPAVVEGYRSIADAATVASDEQVQALDTAGDAWSAFLSSLGTGFVKGMGTIVLAAREAVGATGTIQAKLSDLAADERLYIGTLMRSGQDYRAELARLLAAHGATATVQAESNKQKKDAAPIVESYATQLAAARAMVTGLTGAQRLELSTAKDLGVSTDELTERFGLNTQALKLIETDTRNHEKAVRASEQAIAKQAAETKKATEADDKFRASIHATTSQFIPFMAGLQDSTVFLEELSNLAGGFEKNGDLLSQSIREAGLAAAEADKEMLDWAHTNGAVLAPSIEHVSATLKAQGVDVRQWADSWTGIKAGLRSALGDFSQTLVSALTGGGDVWGAVRAFASKVGATIGGGVGEYFGGPMGKMIGEQLGAVLGPALGAIGKGLKSLFGIGVNDEVKKYNAEIEKVRGTLLSIHGPMDALEAKAKAVGLSFKNEWGHQGKAGLDMFNAFVREFDVRVGDVNTSFSELFRTATQTGTQIPAHLRPVIEHLIQIGVLTKENAIAFGAMGREGEVDFKKMQDAAKTYGIDLANLGPKFQSAKLHDAAKTIWDDFQLLKGGGADVGAVLLGMSGSISQLVRDSIQFGVDIPENMRPMIQSIMDAGKLIGEDGQALTDMSQINFGAPIIDGFTRIVDKIEELIGKITGPLTAATQSVPPIHVPVVYDDPGFTPRGSGDGDWRPDGDHEGFAGGGARDFGRGTRVVLHGRELVLPLDRPSLIGHRLIREIVSVSERGSSGRDDARFAQLEEALIRLTNTVKQMPTEIARAQRDGMLQLGSR